MFESAYCCLQFRRYRDPKMKSPSTLGNWFDLVGWLSTRYRIMVWEGEEEMVFEDKVKISYWEGDIIDQSWEQRESALITAFGKGVSSSSSAVRLGGKLCLLHLSRDLITESLSGWGWKEILQVVQSSPHAPAGTPESQLPRSMSRWFWVSSQVDTLQPLWRNLCLENFLWKLRFQWEQCLNDKDRSGAVRGSAWHFNSLWALCRMS